MKIEIRKNGIRSNREQFMQNVYMLKKSTVNKIDSILHTFSFGLLRGIIQIIPNDSKFHWNK